jgi:hypothetical protein
VPPAVIDLAGWAPLSNHQVSLAYFANEGDLARVGDSVTIGGIKLSDGNAFNSSLLGASNPTYPNGFGIDIDQYPPAEVTSADDGTIRTTMVSTGDKTSVGLVGFVVT